MVSESDFPTVSSWPRLCENFRPPANIVYCFQAIRQTQALQNPLTSASRINLCPGLIALPIFHTASAERGWAISEHYRG